VCLPLHERQPLQLPAGNPAGPLDI
jgi:hypothetical protein